MQLGLYEIYRQYRFALSLSGFAFPDPDQLFHPLAQQFINPRTNVQSMPHREFPIEQDHCLFFPAGCTSPQRRLCRTGCRHIGTLHEMAAQLSVLVHRGRTVRPGRRSEVGRRRVAGEDHRAHEESVSAQDRRALLGKPRQRRGFPSPSRRRGRLGWRRPRQVEAAELESRWRPRLRLQVLGSHRGHDSTPPTETQLEPPAASLEPAC